MLRVEAETLRSKDKEREAEREAVATCGSYSAKKVEDGGKLLKTIS